METPGALADLTVGVEHEGTQPRQRELLALPFGRHRAGHLLVLGAEALDLSLEGDVLLSEDLVGGAETTQ